jgi:hypothetical protein
MVRLYNLRSSDVDWRREGAERERERERETERERYIERGGKRGQLTPQVNFVCTRGIVVRPEMYVGRQ